MKICRKSMQTAYTETGGRKRNYRGGNEAIEGQCCRAGTRQPGDVMLPGGNEATEANAMLSGGNGAYADAYQQAVPGVCSVSCSALRLKMM